jgi:hypothetical protein
MYGDNFTGPSQDASFSTDFLLTLLHPPNDGLLGLCFLNFRNNFHFCIIRNKKRYIDNYHILGLRKYTTLKNKYHMPLSLSKKPNYN